MSSSGDPDRSARMLSIAVSQFFLRREPSFVEPLRLGALSFTTVLFESFFNFFSVIWFVSIIAA